MEEKIKQIIMEQRQLFDTQKTYPIEFRLKKLKQLKVQINRYEDDLLEALYQDLGKSASESFITEIGLVYRHIDEMVKKLPKWGKIKRVPTPLFLMPAKSYTLQVPFGNTLIIAPFNYPVLLTLDPLIGSIAGGNTAIVAMSEHTPKTNLVLRTLIAEAFTADYLFFLTGNREINESLLEHKFDKIFFTGSQKVGQIVLKKAAEHLTPTTLELGGKSPVIVTKYADLELAAERIVWGKFLNAGQTCVAPDYCLIDENIKAEFMPLLINNIHRFFGDNIEKSPDYGRLINNQSLERLLVLLNQDKKYIEFGSHFNEAERYLEPTIVSAKLEDSLALMEEEIFGPILPVLSYKKLEEGIAFIAKRDKPLAFYPFSSDKNELDDLIQRVSFGGATINDTVLHLANEHLPFGGVGTSGIGSYHGYKTLETFTHTKSVLKRSTLLRIPLLFPPYTTDKNNIIRLFFK